MQKQHHTVPECYLKNFTDKNGFIWVLDVKDNIFKTKPKSVLKEKDFYTITLKNGEKSVFIENTLAKIEGSYVNVFKNVITRGEAITGNNRETISLFVAALMLRTRPRRDAMKNVFETLKVSLCEWKKQFETMSPQSLKSVSTVSHNNGESISLDDISKFLEDFDEEHSKSIVTNLLEIAQIIFNMKWSILINTDVGFVTCDDPLVLLRPNSIKKYGPNAIGSRPGLNYKDVELTLPLSKDRALLAGWILKQDSYLPANDKETQHINHRTITHSSERIIVDSEEKAIAIKERYTETKYKHKSS